MSILLVTDLSDAAEGPTRLAVALARRQNVALTLLHVIEPGAEARLEQADAHRYSHLLRHRALVTLEATATELRSHGIEVSPRVEGGAFGPTVAQLGQSTGSTLIMLAGGHLRIANGIPPELMRAGAPSVAILPCDPLPLETLARVSTGGTLRVLLAIDQTASSAAAVRWVRALRATGPTDVFLLHAYDPDQQFRRLGPRSPNWQNAPRSSMEEVIEREIRAFVGELPGEGNTEVHLLPIWRSPGETLLEAARALSPDLIAMGLREHGNWERVWVGSTGERLVRSAPAPVVCVPAAVASPVALPILKSVLACTDFSALGNAALLHAIGLVGAAGGVVHLCHVAEPTKGLGSEMSPADLEGLRSQLENLVPDAAAHAGVQVTPLVLEGSKVGQIVAQAAHRMGVDAICVASHGRSGLQRAILGSVTQDLLAAAPCPVFVVRGSGNI